MSTEGTTATLSEPKVGPVKTADVPAGSDPGQGSTPGPAHTPEPPANLGKKSDTSKILDKLYRDDPKAYRHYQRTGELPAELQEQVDRRPTLNEGEAILQDLTAAERESWIETGDLPHRFSEEGKAEAATRAREKAAENAAKTEAASETNHPLSKIDGLRAGKKDAEADALHTERAGTHNQRYQADRARYSEADQKTLIAAAQKLFPQIPKNLAAFFDTAQVHLENPYTFFNDFVLDGKFRNEIVTAAVSGDAANIVKVMVKHDAAVAQKLREEAKARTPKDPPAPATRIEGNNTPAPDEENSALSAGDFSRYQRAANLKAYRRRRYGE